MSANVRGWVDFWNGTGLSFGVFLDGMTLPGPGAIATSPSEVKQFHQLLPRRICTWSEEALATKALVRVRLHQHMTAVAALNFELHAVKADHLKYLTRVIGSMRIAAGLPGEVSTDPFQDVVDSMVWATPQPVARARMRVVDRLIAETYRRLAA